MTSNLATNPVEITLQAGFYAISIDDSLSKLAEDRFRSLLNTQTEALTGKNADFSSERGDVLSTEEGFGNSIEKCIDSVRQVESYVTFERINDVLGEQRASLPDQRNQALMDLLIKWREPQSFYVYPLDNHYSSKDMKISKLRGLDQCRAHAVAEACGIAGFHMFLAEIEVLYYSFSSTPCLSDECKQIIHLADIANLEGDRIMAATRFVIPLVNTGKSRKSFIIRPTQGIRRRSALMILPNRSIAKFLHDGAAICRMGLDHAYISRRIAYWGSQCCNWLWYMGIDGYKDQIEFCDRPVQSWCPHIEYVLKRLKGISSNRADLQEFLLQICTNILLDWPDKDAYTGPVAEIAILLGNEGLFLNALKYTPHGFCRDSWRRFGEALDLWNLVISQENITMALTKSRNFNKIYQNMLQFRHGLEQRFKEPYETAYIRGWTDEILITLLNQMTEVHMSDCPALMDMVARRKSHHFYQFVAYQSVRQFVLRMLGHYGFASGILLELSIRLQDTDPFCKFLTGLSELVREQAVSEFNFEGVIEYIFNRARSSRDRQDMLFQSLFRIIGPQNQAKLFQKISSGSHYLAQQRRDKVIESILSGIIVATETPSPEARECFESLFLAYASILIGYEAPVPSVDLSWPEEAEEEVIHTCCCNQHADVESCACHDKSRALLRNLTVCSTQVCCVLARSVKFTYRRYQHRRGEEQLFVPTTADAREELWTSYRLRSWSICCSLTKRLSCDEGIYRLFRN